ncbi:hypothetical protein ACOSQ3_026892 [Xanthoceras sorbifolium]
MILIPSHKSEKKKEINLDFQRTFKIIFLMTRHVYMFSYAMNIVLGRREEKHLISGVYTIANIYCSKCGKELGWHYLRAHDLKNRCKEGNFIIEKLKMLKEEY